MHAAPVCSAIPEAVLIAGPTASGKSALAMALAEKTGGVIVNADSMQVYADLRIITARPSQEEEARCTHRLFGHVDADSDYSVGRWTTDAAEVLAAIRAAGRLPIFVGGTGLYFRALTQGLAPVPPIPEEVRARIRLEAEADTAQVLHARLATRDPLTAFGLRPTDRQRILRALEVVEATGKPLAEWQAQAGAPLLDGGTSLRVVLEMDRDQLRARIDSRFQDMLRAGALDEVAVLMGRDLPPERTILKAHGVPALMRHLRGELDLACAAQEGQADTRRYAKRQQTWFRHQMPDWERHAPDTALPALLARFA
ncbi:tRNA (adenosine(37)-N6)-dimethylallyltransferase MiaA [Aquabacter cavernae]|uniref:tRNA (adenosine(37)-N6)-dimethylallyltransferase MiaA n=1 Tax=Aquabacter cavernae TaxID=2496029 RepID=UPI000F8EAE04|nr:tRNA (adenosine(37)-N6)-dimethylallyltransferase MiaA [Aquabacter cavernae]